MWTKLANRKLGRTTDIRKSMLKNLTTDLCMEKLQQQKQELKKLNL